jgi:hypothetical protein
MKEQAKELMRKGNHLEITYGNGMLEVIDKVMDIINIDGDKLTDGEVLDAIYDLLDSNHYQQVISGNDKNELIRAFMPELEIEISDNVGQSIEEFHSNELKFYSDWNWLMPVIEKCFIGEGEINSVSKEVIDSIYEGMCRADIGQTYDAVVEYIQWRNKNN